MSDRDQNSVMVPSVIFSPSEMIEAEFILDLSIALLDRPSLMSGFHQFSKLSFDRKIGEVILRLVRPFLN